MLAGSGSRICVSGGVPSVVPGAHPVDCDDGMSRCRDPFGRTATTGRHVRLLPARPPTTSMFDAERPTGWTSELSPPFRSVLTGIVDSAVTPGWETRAGRASRVRGRRD